MSAMGTNVSPDDNADEANALYTMQLVNSSVLPMTLKTAIELGILETISTAGQGARLYAAELSSCLPGLSNPHAIAMLDRILSLLASHSILTCSLSPSGERRYGAAPVCKYLTPNAEGLSLAGLALVFLDRVLMESWYHLKDAVLEGGIPFEKAYGMPSYDYLRIDPRINKLFNVGLSGHSSILSSKLLEKYKGFDGLKSLVDVGGGIGTTLGMITAKYPGIRGINFDIASVISEAPPLLGVEHVEGDMFESVPAADAIFIKCVLHNWRDEHCLNLLKNCSKALPAKGKVILFEFILPVEPTPDPSAQLVFLMDLLMLANQGGKERTLKEFESLARHAGFSDFKSFYIFSGCWVMEITK